MKIYVASSWRNTFQPGAVAALRAAGHDVYDFRNPAPGEHGFAWSDVDPDWQRWTVTDFRRGLRHELARRAFQRDRDALEWCDVCVLVLPSGMSAHLEAGWCQGQGKMVFVYAPELREPELMYKLFDLEDETPLYSTLEDVVSRLRVPVHHG
jgi:hypothetical protein